MILNLLTFFIIGSALLFLLTFMVYRSKIINMTKEARLNLNRKQIVLSLIILGLLFLLMVGFFVLFQVLTFTKACGFFCIVIWTFILMMLLVCFDSFCVDLFVIGRIRPAFLHIPEKTTIDTMRKHVKKQFTVGWTYIIPIILISSFIGYMLIHY